MTSSRSSSLCRSDLDLSIPCVEGAPANSCGHEDILPGSRAREQAIQILQSSVGEQLHGTGEIAKMVGVVASLQDDRESVRAAYAADVARLQNELNMLRLAIRAHLDSAQLDAIQEEASEEDQEEEEAQLRLLYKELEEMDIAMQAAVQENLALKSQKEACQSAQERDIHVLEGMLKQAMQENHRLTKVLMVDGKISPTLTPREINEALEKTVISNLRQHGMKYHPKLPLDAIDATASSSSDEDVAQTPKSASRSSSSNEPESEGFGHIEFDRFKLVVSQATCA